MEKSDTELQKIYLYINWSQKNIKYNLAMT